MSTLAAFLLARFAEDEAVARDLLTGYRREYRHEGYAAETWSNPDYSEEGVSLSPERVLAECEAKRRIVDKISGYLRSHISDDFSGERLGEDVLDLLALPYADHPDYRPEWAPQG